MQAGAPPLVLASASESRAALLRAAGLGFEVEPAGVDEAERRRALAAEGAPAAAAALELAERKAAAISRRRPEALVIGADQILDCAGAWYEKPRDRAHARAQLRALRGRAHVLATAVCVARAGVRLWSHDESPRLVMRAFSDAFLDAYLTEIGAGVLGVVGGYRIEDRGAQLFARIEGDYFAILGLPLLPLLDFLRGHGVVTR